MLAEFLAPALNWDYPFQPIRGPRQAEVVTRWLGSYGPGWLRHSLPFLSPGRFETSSDPPAAMASTGFQQRRCPGYYPSPSEWWNLLSVGSRFPRSWVGHAFRAIPPTPDFPSPIQPTEQVPAGPHPQQPAVPRLIPGCCGLSWLTSAKN